MVLFEDGVDFNDIDLEIILTFVEIFIALFFEIILKIFLLALVSRFCFDPRYFDFL